MSVIIREVLPGCGQKWYTQSVIDRNDWLQENLEGGSYKTWYGGVTSDDRYTKFLNDEDALMYKFMWMTVPVDNATK